MFSNCFFKYILNLISALGIILAFLTSCTNNKIIEDPFKVAKSYCSCLDETIKNSKDSLINIYDCEKIVFPDSRFMRIYMAFDDNSNYTQSTIDSARNFSLKVGNIIDTMCINKIKSEKKKKIPHAAM